MKWKKTIFVSMIVCLIIPVAGCLDDDGGGGSAVANKEDLKKAVIQHFQYLIDGNANGFLSGYSEDFIDLGGGSEGDGSVDWDEFEKNVKEFMGSEEWEEEYADLTVEEMFDIEEMGVYDYEEIMADEDLQWERHGFEISEDTFLVSMKPAMGSPFFDGFFAYYRIIKGKWKIVATD